MIDYLWLLIALPLIGAATLILFGRRIGEPASGWLASALVLVPFVMAAVLTVPFINGTEEPQTIFVFSWIPMVGANASLLWDPLSALMTLIVTGVGSLIHIYSISYMDHDPERKEELHRSLYESYDQQLKEMQLADEVNAASMWVIGYGRRTQSPAISRPSTSAITCKSAVADSGSSNNSPVGISS